MTTDAASRNRGFVLLAAIALLALTFLLGALALGIGCLELAHSASDTWSRQAVSNAEAGIQWVKARLLADWCDSGSWRDGSIDGLDAPVTEDVWLDLVDWTVFRTGSYRVSYRFIPGSERQIVLRAQGQAGRRRSMRQVDVVYGVVGGPGALTILEEATGPVSVCGSCWLWGAGVTGTVLELGPSGMRNHYAAIPPELEQHLPDCPLAEHNGEMVESLWASLHVRNGDVTGLGATLGEPDQPGNATMELLDALSSNGTLPLERYAVREAEAPVEWPNYPSLESPYPCGGGWSSYRDFYRRGGLAPVWPGDLRLSPPVSNGSFGSEWGDSLTWRTYGNVLRLHIAGNIEVEGDLVLGELGWVVRYSGRGYIHCGGSVEIRGNLLPAGLLGQEDLLCISTGCGVRVCGEQEVYLGLCLHTDDCVTASVPLYLAGAVIARRLIDPDGAYLYEVPAVSARRCCTQDRWVISPGNTRRESYLFGS